MPTVAIISQKGRAGKTTLAVHLAAAAQDAGLVSLVADTDPQATASQWAAWRGDRLPEVIDSPPPHANSAPRAAAEIADLVLIPYCPSAFDLAAIQTTAKFVQLLRKPIFAVSLRVPSTRRASMPRRASWSKLMARLPARSSSPTAPPIAPRARKG